MKFIKEIFIIKKNKRGKEPDVYIRATEGIKLDELNRIAIESEAYWGSDSDFMEKFKTTYKVTEEFIKKNPTFILFEENQIVEFYSLSIKAEENEIEFFYIDPQYIGKGYGKKMWNHLIDYCKEIRIKEIILITSPPAKEFYEKMGAIQIDEVESLLRKGRIIPKLKYEFIEA